MDDGPGDGRTVYGRIVPYGQVISFLNHRGEVERERFVQGAFAKQANAFHRVTLSFEHQDGFHNTVGYGQRIREESDGAYATFRLYEADAPKVRDMIASSHDSLSVEFEARGTRETVDEAGVIVRDNVHLHRVGITGSPAYVDAKVLAVREATREPTPHLDDVRAWLNEQRRNAP
jgi:HK97 family phage prohead protease